MTDQMEPVDDATKYRRKIDESLARFSAAHDELEAEEKQRRQKRQKFVARVEQTMTALQRVVSVGPKSGAKTAERSGERSGGRRGGRSAERDDDDSDPEPAGAGVTATADPAPSPPADPDPDAPADPVTALGADSAAEIPHEHGRSVPDGARRGTRGRTAARVSAAVVAVLVFLGTGAGWGAKTWLDGKFNHVSALDENSKDIRDAAAQIGDANFLIVGSDTRKGAKAEDHVGNAEAIPGARSDTVMLAHVPKDRRRAVVISFPRDLEISRPECERWDPRTGEYGETVGAAEAVKLNSAFTVGGPRCVTKVIQQISGMQISHFVGIDFRGFKGMVDAVGGVTVHLDEPMRDAELGLIVAETGDVVLRGDQALNFVRARKVYGDPTFSDYGRMKRQQQFMSSLLRKTLSSDVLLDMGKLTGFVNAFSSATFGENIGVEQMLVLARSMRGLDAGNVTFLTVPTVGEANERGNEVLLTDETDALFQALIDNAPLPGEEPAGRETAREAGDQDGAGSDSPPDSRSVSR